MSEQQNVETQSQPIEKGNNYKSTNSSAETIVEKIDLAESEPEKSETAPEKSEAPLTENDAESELPEFAKRRLGKEKKKYERELARMRAELDDLRGKTSQTVSPQAQFGAPSQNGYVDPITQKYIDVSTPEGQAIYQYQQQMSQALSAQEQEQKAREQKEIEYKLHEHFESSFEDAADKYSDFKDVVKNAGMNLNLGRELAYFSNPGELAYYLGSNPQEVARLQRLPAYEMKRELTRHMAEMVQKNNITRAPAPIKPVGSGGASPVKHFSHKTYSELKAERRAQIRGSRSR